MTHRGPVLLRLALDHFLNQDGPVVKSKVPPGIDVSAKLHPCHGSALTTPNHIHPRVRRFGIEVVRFLRDVVRFIHLEAGCTSNHRGYRRKNRAHRCAHHTEIFIVVIKALNVGPSVIVVNSRIEGAIVGPTQFAAQSRLALGCQAGVLAPGDKVATGSAQLVGSR